MSKTLPRVVLVGRINAGKSTLFNTLTETRKAIISAVPGTTRDLNEADISWRDKTFTLVDTGGLDAAHLGQIEVYVQRKAYQAIEQADLIVLVYDGKNEITKADREIANKLLKTNKQIIIAINKIDSQQLQNKVTDDIYKFGIKNISFISATSGRGTGDLLDEIVKLIPKKSKKEIVYDLKLSIIGKTNVGKSSILNCLLGVDKVIVTPIPHTTREPQDTIMTYKGKKILIVDTAGLRKKKKLSDKIEKYSAHKTLVTIKNSDISLFVIEAGQKLSSQDQTIVELARENFNGIIIVANKWDLVDDKDPSTINEFIKYYQTYLPWLSWAPVIFTSAKEKTRVHQLLELALQVQAAREKIIDDANLDKIMHATYLKKAKPSKGKKSTVPLGLKQTGTCPPKFELLTHRPDRINPAYLNLLQKKIREKYGFKGTPIIMTMTKVK